MMAQPPIRIGIVDDQQMVRAGMRLILHQAPDLLVVGEAGDGLQALTMAAQTRPDVVLMDIRMPIVDGVEATRRICTAGATAPKILILTTYDLDEYVFAALHAGASGFLLKDILAADLHAAVRVIHSGDGVAAPTVTRRLIAHFATSARQPQRLSDDARLAPLTLREREVLTLVTHGLTNAEIAARLWLSAGTVKTHVSHILTKLELRDRVRAVILGYQTGLADLAMPGREGGTGTGHVERGAGR